MIGYVCCASVCAYVYLWFKSLTEHSTFLRFYFACCRASDWNGFLCSFISVNWLVRSGKFAQRVNLILWWCHKRWISSYLMANGFGAYDVKKNQRRKISEIISYRRKWAHNTSAVFVYSPRNHIQIGVQLFSTEFFFCVCVRRLGFYTIQPSDCDLFIKLLVFYCQKWNRNTDTRARERAHKHYDYKLHRKMTLIKRFLLHLSVVVSWCFCWCCRCYCCSDLGCIVLEICLKWLGWGGNFNKIKTWIKAKPFGV